MRVLLQTVTFKDRQPLFYPASDSEDGELDLKGGTQGSSATLIRPCYSDADEFEIDQSMFDIEPGSNSPVFRGPPKEAPDCAYSKSPSQSDFGIRELVHPESPRKPSAAVVKAGARVPVSGIGMNRTQQVTVGLANAPEDPVQDDPFQNDLAELEEWLQSDAVVIVDHLD